MPPIAAREPRDRLRVAIQKSGRLGDPARDLLSAVGLTWRESRDRLFCFGEGLPIDLLLVRDDDIPGLLTEGVADFGILGRNVLAETGLDGTAPGLEEVRQLGFGPCRLAIGVPEGWDYEGPAQLEGLRIATSYPAITQDWLRRHGVDARTVTLSGSVEIAPSLGQADVVCDLVSSGGTLRANSLKPVETLLESEAVLAAPPGRPEGVRGELADLLLRRLDGVRRVADSKVLTARVPRGRVAELVGLLPDAEAPILTPALELGPDGPTDSGMFAVQALCHGEVSWAVLERLKAAGAEGLTVLPVEGMLV
ncbi:ATP phosphoribosyltransferase (homohexameric) [Kytococcus aerolatus]|uniref:ATP phosphoribosyltransferase n=1 Tax=Kytococcus aerolatus TaxID=592308 RepID=A0A212U111_9MICO|nr:ATP phosphoribosyltransferase [Kytococcus aerolatus]SNC71804.1 ATP phosphoribosyltransferase (homohexameric) [Kytococcus aerolatus]